MFLSGYGMAAREIRQAAERRDQLLKAQETAEPPTPGHSAAEAANEYARDTAEAAEAQRRRQRIQHEVDPYLHEAPEVDHLDPAGLGKRYNQAVDFPEGYPPTQHVTAEDFRRPPSAEGHAAFSPGYAPPTQPVSIPGLVMPPTAVTGPEFSRPHAPEIFESARLGPARRDELLNPGQR